MPVLALGRRLHFLEHKWNKNWVFEVLFEECDLFPGIIKKGWSSLGDQLQFGSCYETLNCCLELS